MRRIALALLPLLFGTGLVSPLLAQAPAGFVTVTASRILDGGVPLAAGKVSAQFLAKGQSFAASVGGGGQATTSQISARVTNGAFVIYLPDTYLTNPQYACLALTVSDPAGNPIARFPCVQPGSAPSGPQSAWCTTAALPAPAQTTCNFDRYTQALPALALQQPGLPGPQGPAGPPGSGSGGIGLDPTPAVTGAGHNGIANLAASAPCLSARCLIAVPPTYTPLEQNPFDLLLFHAYPLPAAAFPAGTAVDDLRGGTQWHGVTNPTLGNNGVSWTGRRLSLVERRSTAELLAQGGTLGLNLGDEVNALFTGPGNDDETSLHGKSTFLIQALNGNFSSVGQNGGGGYHLLGFANSGDLNTNSNYIVSAAGAAQGGGEGTHGTWEHLDGFDYVPTGTCALGCTPGSTRIVFNTPVYKQLGQNRYLLDVSRANSTGALVSATLPSGAMPWLVSNFTGTAFGASVFLESAIAVTDTASSTSPGLVTVPIKTTPDFAHFAGSTAGLSTSGVACIADSDLSEGVRWESAPYTLVDATHLAITFYKLHKAGFGIGIGGACGSGFEQTATTVHGIRQIFPALGSVDNTHVVVASPLSALGVSGASGASAFSNISCLAVSVSRTGNVATLEVPQYCTGGTFRNLFGLPVNVTGMADTSFNATGAVAALGPPSGYFLTYPSPGPDTAQASVSSGAVGFWTPGFVQYPLAETLDVRNGGADVDGTLTLGANTIPFAPGDALEQAVGSYPVFNGGFVHLRSTSPVLGSATGYAAELTGQEAYHADSNVFVATDTHPVTDFQGGGGRNPVPNAPYRATGAFAWAADLPLGKVGGINFTASPFCTPAALFFCNQPLFNLPSGQMFYKMDPTGAARASLNFSYLDLQVDGKPVCTFDGTTSSNCPPSSGADATARTAAAAAQATASAALPASGGTATGPINASALGPEFKADQFTGSDPSAKINACLTQAAINANSTSGGPTFCDARAYVGVQNMSQQINVPDHTVLMLPKQARWQWSFTDGTSVGIWHKSGGVIVGEAAGGGGGGMILAPASASVNMLALYATDAGTGNTAPAGGGSYVRASGFRATNDVGATFSHGVVYTRWLFDESLIERVTAQNNTGDAWHVYQVCCSTSFLNDQAISAYGAGGGTPMVVEANGSSSFLFTGTINAAGNGHPNLDIQTGNNLIQLSAYMEANTTDTTTAAVNNASAVPPQFFGGTLNRFGTSKPCFSDPNQAGLFDSGLCPDGPTYGNPNIAANHFLFSKPNGAPADSGVVMYGNQINFPKSIFASGRLANENSAGFPNARIGVGPAGDTGRLLLEDNAGHVGELDFRAGGWNFYNNPLYAISSINGVALIPNIQIALPTAPIPANTCTTPGTASMPGVLGTSTFSPTYASNPNAVTGWGVTGGLDLSLWPSTDTLNYSVCNVTGASITPGALTMNVGAR